MLILKEQVTFNGIDENGQKSRRLMFNTSLKFITVKQFFSLGFSIYMFNKFDTDADKTKWVCLKCRS